MKPLPDHIRAHREKCERAKRETGCFTWLHESGWEGVRRLGADQLAHIAASSPAIVRALLDVAEAAEAMDHSVNHNYWDGLCPDDVDGWQRRNDECPACRLLAKKDRALAALHAAYEAGERSKT